MHRGYVKSWRKMVEWGWYKDVPTRSLFEHLLRVANGKDKISYGVHVKRGQVITGRKKLSFETGLSEQQVRTALKKLLKTNEISTKIATKSYTIITIINYSEYQVTEEHHQPDLQPRSNQEATKKQPLSKNVKNVKNVKNTTIKAFSPFSIKPDSVTEEDWKDLILHRKKVKATETERAYKTIIAQLSIAEKNGFSPKTCIDEICNRSWRGFKAEWMNKKDFNSTPGLNGEIPKVGSMGPWIPYQEDV